MDQDEKLLRRAEKALSQIKVAQGLSDAHASVLAALRIRLRGDPGKSLEDLLSAAGDLGGPDLARLMESEGHQEAGSFEDAISRAPKRSKPTLEQAARRSEGPKRSLEDLLGGSGDEGGSKPPPSDPGGHR